MPGSILRAALFAACLAPFLSGCSLRTIAVRTTGGLLAEGKSAFHEESDPILAGEAMPGQLKLLEALLESDPRNPDLLDALAEGYAGYAFLFLEESAPDRAAALYRRAASYGLRRLERGLPGLAAMRPEPMREALAKAGQESVPALYWTATAWAGWANLAKDEPEALAAVPKAVRFMERVMELDPGYQFGGPDAFFGVYYAARPRIAGGDPAKAKAHFEEALRRAGRRFLMTQYLMMRYYSVAVLDEELFRELGAELAAADAGALPEARLANEAAKIKAKTLSERFDDLF